MSKIHKKIFGSRNTTLVKYFLSYFVILSMLILGFFFAVRKQLKDIYFNTMDERIQDRLELIREQFRGDITGINQLHSHLISDIDLILSRCTNSSWYRYQASQRINEYTISNNFVTEIVYIDRVNQQIISSGKYVRFKDGEYSISVDNVFVPLPLDEYGHNGNNSFLFLKSKKEKNNLLLYFPNVDSSEFDLFYVISNTELNNLLKSGISDGVVSMVMTNDSQELITGVNENLLLPPPSGENAAGEGADGFLPDLSPGITSRTDTADNSNETIYTVTLYGDLKITALFSRDTLLHYVDAAFRDTYIALVLIGVLGILLILWGMRQTYWPLHKLTKKLVENPNPEGSYVEQIDQAFTSAVTENQQLQSKVDNYRIAMQKSILDSIISESNNDAKVSIDNIDQLFNMEPGSYIYVVKVMAKEGTSPLQRFKAFLGAFMPQENSCIPLEISGNTAVFLVYYGGTDKDKDEVLKLLMQDLYEETGYYAAISNSSTSPLDIPALYENAALASSYWDKMPVSSFLDIESPDSDEISRSYPYRKLDNLTHLLQEQSFEEARVQVGDLLDSIQEESYPAFFIRCILIDILTMYVNVMNRLNVKFKSYSDLYFETLYFCRSFPYHEKKEEIRKNTYHLIDIFESEISNSTIHSDQIRNIVMENYNSPEFSISSLADSFHVSIAYMSYLFKKKFNQNFSDYLWELRLEKAKELLKNTDMPIDTVSVEVGYLNPSSFRRKFKQTMGIAPSQYRSGE